MSEVTRIGGICCEIDTGQCSQHSYEQSSRASTLHDLVTCPALSHEEPALGWHDWQLCIGMVSDWYGGQKLRVKVRVPRLRHAAEDRYRVRGEHAEHRLRQRPPQDGVLHAHARTAERRASMLCLQHTPDDALQP